MEFQFGWFRISATKLRNFLTLKYMKNIIPSLPGSRFKQPGSHFVGTRQKASLVHINAITIHAFYDESNENLSNRSDDISIHQKHLLHLAIEIYKSLTKFILGSWGISLRESILLIIYDEVTYCFYCQLNLFAMVLIL